MPKSHARRKTKSSKQKRKQGYTPTVPLATPQAPPVVRPEPPTARPTSPTVARPAPPLATARLPRRAEPPTAAEYSYVISDLKRIGVMASAIFAVLILLAFVIR